MERNLKKVVYAGLVFLAALALCGNESVSGQARLQQSEAVTLRYRWQVGETLHYSVRMNVEATAVSAEGYRANVLSLNMNMPVSFQVLAVEPSGTAAVAIRYGDVKMAMGVLGQKLDVGVTARSVTASLNGTSLPASQLAELKGDLAPVQRLIRDGLRLVISDRGLVLRAAGTSAPSRRQIRDGQDPGWRFLQVYNGEPGRPAGSAH